MANNLPEKWDTPLLGDVVTIKSGNSKLTKKSYISNGKYTAFSGSGPDGKTNFYEHEGDAIILSAVGARCGKCFRAKGKWTAIANTSIIRTKVDDKDVYRYLFYMFNNENFWPKGGTGQPFVKSGIALKEMRIPFPPIPHQKLIADKLDVLLAKVKDAQSRLDKIPLILNRFRQSVLAAACSGRLTADWRDSRDENQFNDIDGLVNLRNFIDVEELLDVPKSWKWVPLQSVCDPKRFICYGVIKLGHECINGVPCLRTSDVKPLNIDISDVKKIDSEISAQYERTLLKGGEILVNVRGTLGGVAVVPETLKGWNVSREVAVIPIVNILPQFVAFWIASIPCQNWLTSVSKGVAYTGINIKDLKVLPIALPTLEEQKEIVRRVTELFALADHISSRYKKAQGHVNRLKQSILAKAFRGELVPQKK